MSLSKVTSTQENTVIKTDMAPASHLNMRSALTLLFLSLIWGTSFILIKRGLGVFSPVQVASLRITIASVAFVPILLRQLHRVDWSRWRALVVVGLAGSGIPAFMFAFAQTELSSAVAGILNSLTPLFTLVLGLAFFGSPFQSEKLVGVLVGMVGAVMLILFGSSGGETGNAWYSLFIVFGAVCYGTSVNTVGTHLRDMNPVAISAVSFFMIGIPASVILFSTDFVEVMRVDPGAWTALGYMVVLALGSTVLASIIFFQLVQWTTPVFSSTVAYIIPVVALVWGLLDGERITPWHLLGMGLILAGVYWSRR